MVISNIIKPHPHAADPYHKTILYKTGFLWMSLTIGNPTVKMSRGILSLLNILD